jgi:hypothetical protein
LIAREGTVMQAIHPSIGPIQYWVFSADGKHVGPVSAELIARGVAAGKVPEDAFVAPAGTTAWVQIGSVPEIAEAMRAAGSRPSSMRPSSMNMPSVQPAIPPAPPLPGDVPVPIASPLAPPAPAPEPFAGAAPPLGGAAPAPEAVPQAEAKKEEMKDEPKKPALDPKLKLLPVAIFGVCAFIGILETAIVLIARG